MQYTIMKNNHLWEIVNVTDSDSTYQAERNTLQFLGYALNDELFPDDFI